MRRLRNTSIMDGRISLGRFPSVAPDYLGKDKFAIREFQEEQLTPEELDLSAEPCESEFGTETFEEMVFDESVYNSLCMAIHGQVLWDSAEEQEVE